MANRTVKDAQTVKGTNPQYLVEKIIRSRIYDCKYWKEECFALTCKYSNTLNSAHFGTRNIPHYSRSALFEVTVK